MLCIKIKKQLGSGSVANGRACGGPSSADNAGTGFDLDVDFVVPSGVTILFGPSGAGKTTVLRCIAGVVRPDVGSIAISRPALFDSQQGIDLPVRKRGVGYVFQDLP